MFDNLMESRRIPVRRAGGSLASILVHAGLVAALVAVTADAAVREPDEPPPTDQLVYTHQPPPEAVARATPAARPSASASAAIATPAAVTIPSVIEIPDVLPPIDLTRALPGDLQVRRSDAAGTRGLSSGAQGAIDADGTFRGWNVEKPVVLAPGSHAPEYPVALRAAGVEGRVMMQFVVDTTGRVEAGTVRVLQSDHVAFAESVRRVLPSLRFLPAEVGGRRVRQLVQLPFRFGLDRD